MRIDFAPTLRPPRTATMITATILAILGSLAADVILVQLGKSLFPAYQNYVHFQFSDYSKLTVIGVVIACAAWPIVTRISSAPQWVFFDWRFS